MHKKVEGAGVGDGDGDPFEHLGFQRVDKLQNRDSLSKMRRPICNKKRKNRRCMKVGIDQKSHGSDTAAPADVMVPKAGFGFEPTTRFTLGEFY
ncbi:hypothetical protein L6452_13298 [Arctium lappa]|uniref:Uncharacterized protein n=1 Tax=Arctium lappa TaxID=4217 RepID=A0ACB9CHX1_ARCLA|nr:hypothetical protein L6452_13298 [Arctium lappa]